MGTLQKLRTASKFALMRGNGWESSTGGQPRGGVPNIYCQTETVSSALKHCLKSKSRCPRSAPSKCRRSQALRIASGVRPQFPALAYLPALTPASPDLLISDPGSGSRLTLTPAAGLRPTGTSLRHFRSVSPPGDRLQKKNVPPSFRPPQLTVAGFQFECGLGTCGRGERKNDCSLRGSWSGTCCQGTPEGVTRARKESVTQKWGTQSRSWVGGEVF